MQKFSQIEQKEEEEEERISQKTVRKFLEEGKNQNQKLALSILVIKEYM
jgi:hypothetical protein